MNRLQAFRRIFYGLMLVLLNFRIGPVDILPNFLGYIFVVAGLGILSDESRHFEKAKFFASILVFTSLLDFVQEPHTIQAPQQNGFFISSTVSPIPIMVAALIAGILKVIMVYQVCEGIQEMASLENPDLEASVQYRKKVYIIVNYLWLLWMPTSLNFTETWVSVVGFLLVISTFFTEIKFITLVHGAGTKLGEGNIG